jgi:hypothetical protein
LATKAYSNNLYGVRVVCGSIRADILGRWLLLQRSFGMHFETASCWQGISAIGAGLVGLFKWLIDSKLNTEQGHIQK